MFLQGILDDHNRVNTQQLSRTFNASPSGCRHPFGLTLHTFNSRLKICREKRPYSVQSASSAATRIRYPAISWRSAAAFPGGRHASPSVQQRQRASRCKTRLSDKRRGKARTPSKGRTWRRQFIARLAHGDDGFGVPLNPGNVHCRGIDKQRFDAAGAPARLSGRSRGAGEARGGRCVLAGLVGTLQAGNAGGNGFSHLMATPLCTESLVLQPRFGTALATTPRLRSWRPWCSVVRAL